MATEGRKKPTKGTRLFLWSVSPVVSGSQPIFLRDIHGFEGTLGDVGGTLGDVGGTLGDVGGTLGDVGGTLGGVIPVRGPGWRYLVGTRASTTYQLVRIRRED